MIRKSVLSMFLGVLFAFVISFGLGAKAECSGECQDSHQSGDCYATYEGCSTEFRCPDWPNPPCTRVTTCVYSLDCDLEIQ